MPKQTLFDLTSEMIEIDNLLEESGGDVSDPELEAAIDRVLDENTGALKTKLDAYVTLIAEYESRAEFLASEAKRLAALAKAKESHAEHLRARLKQFFERTGKEKFETGHFVISLRKSGGKLPLKLHCDPELLPEDYRLTLTTYKANQEAIRAALESGESLVFAELAERGKSLCIR
jgi:hypothetical protein